MSNVSNDKKINEFLERGVENIYPNREFVEELLKGDKQLSVYFGIDPTCPTLHLGNAVILKKLKELQDLGHKITLLIGDFTATIGDPDKLSVRKPLTKKEVLRNAKSYKKQASTFLRFSGINKAEIKYNSKWLSKMRFEDVLNLASKMTVEQMLKRDMFRKRMKEGKPVYIHEFMYPLMQGYDSVVLNVDGEIGGNDQTFNMLAGRTLMKQIKDKEKFVLTLKLLEDKDGKKMGKTEGNMASLSDTPQEMFGKIMSWTDGMISSGFELCTYTAMEEIEKIKESMEKELVNPRDVKMQLAKEIVIIYHGEKEAMKAQSNFIETFQKKGVPENIKEVGIKNGEKLMDVLLTANIVKSKADFKRLVKEGAIKHENEDKIKDEHYEVQQGGIFKIGKKRFIKIKIK
ncbi:MAG TPA: tyrosine--tRNA ligase [Candidatus Yonathbacteria bacterium]|nr:tyrosine--tRNA ligase [Candidatus Yonathbacteria bacterium]